MREALLAARSEVAALRAEASSHEAGVHAAAERHADEVAAVRREAEALRGEDAAALVADSVGLEHQVEAAQAAANPNPNPNPNPSPSPQP